jgi:hypothetical protein
VPAFSDLEIHHIGTGLADNVSQGSAGPVPHGSLVWLGTTDILAARWPHDQPAPAIQAHGSQGSEANSLEQNFDNLSPSQRRIC